MKKRNMKRICSLLIFAITILSSPRFTSFSRSFRQEYSIYSSTKQEEPISIYSSTKKDQEEPISIY